MLQNLHTHTLRCGHATGADVDYIQAAMRGGFDTLGFSEHSPHQYPGGYISRSHISLDSLEEYVKTISTLQKEFEGQIQILLGSEIEYYPALFDDSVKRLQDAGITYLILGQHWVDNEVGLPYLGRPFEDERTLQKYLKQLCAGMNSGLMTYVCHPDVPNFTGSRQLYDDIMRAVCREANSCGLAVEYNLWGIHKKGNYPCDRFWRIAAEENCKAVIGVDAHDPGILENKELYTKAEGFLKSLGLEIVRPHIRSIQ